MRAKKLLVVLIAFCFACSPNSHQDLSEIDEYFGKILDAYPYEISYSFKIMSTDSLGITLPLQLVGLSEQRVGVVDGRTWSLSVVDTTSRLLSRYQSIGNGPEEWLQVNSMSAYKDTISLIDGRQGRIVKIGVIGDKPVPLETRHFKINETGSPRAYFQDSRRMYFLLQKNPIPGRYKSDYTLNWSESTSEDFTPVLTFTDSDAVRDMTSIIYRFSRVLIDYDYDYGVFGINHSDSLIVNLLHANDGTTNRISFKVDSFRENSTFNKNYIRNSFGTDEYKKMITQKETLPIVRSFTVDNGRLFLHLYYFGGIHNVILIHSINDSTTKHVLAPIGFLMYDVRDDVILGTMTDPGSGEQNVAFLKPAVN